MLSQQFIDDRRKQLLELKSQLEEELAGLQLHTEVGDDEDENAMEFAMDEVSTELRSKIEKDLEKIDKALAKIDAGNYGTDIDGNLIPEERLEVEPHADTQA